MERKPDSGLVREAHGLSALARSEIAKRIVGKDSLIRGILMGVIAGGHVLLEGVPGLAKTLAVKTFAEISGLQFSRVQFTPDLLPADITGSLVYEQGSGRFVARKGPVFANLLLADEVNRAPAKTQSALLEAMQENQVTIEGTTLQLPRPFMVLATQNPIEQEGVYRLPEAQLDRFLIRVMMGYPGRRHEVDLLRRHATISQTVGTLFTAEQILGFQSRLHEIHGTETLLEYIVDLAEASRDHPDVSLGASPRASLCLLRCARARAMLDGRHYFTHADVQAVAQGVLGHRLIIRPEAEVEGRRTSDIIKDLLDSVVVLQE